MTTFDLDVQIGDRLGSDTASPVCIPPHLRAGHTWIMGVNATGKTELLERIILGDIARGEGCMVLDPHGDLVNDLMTRLPPEHAQRTFVLEFSDAQWVPALNPLAGVNPANRHHVAGLLTVLLPDARCDFGDRFHHILFCVFCSLLHLSGTSLPDAVEILRRDAKTAKLLRQRVLHAVDGPLLKRFWKYDFHRYSRRELQLLQCKLSSRFLSDPFVSRALGQRQNKLDFRKVLDERQVILVNLSGLSPPTRIMLASFFIGALQFEARVSDAQCPSQTAPFNLHNDGITGIQGEGWEDTLAEGRRQGIRICACLQFLDQLPQAQLDFLEMAGTTISLRVSCHDAPKIRDYLLRQADVTELASLGLFEAVARFGNEVVRFKTRPLPAPNFKGQRAAIIDASHQRYYRTGDEVRREFDKSIRG